MGDLQQASSALFIIYMAVSGFHVCQERTHSRADLLLQSCLLMAHQPQQTRGQSSETLGWRLGSNVGSSCVYPNSLSQFGLFSGESNVNFNRDLYNCTFPLLIDDWRQTFHDGSQGQTERLFPFGFVQVGAERKRVCGLWWGRCC